MLTEKLRSSNGEGESKVRSGLIQYLGSRA